MNLPPYQPPTGDTQSRYDTVRRAEQVCTVCIANVLATPIHEDSTRRNAFASIADAVDRFAITIDSVAPGSVDKFAAVQCLVLARGFAAEAAATGSTWDDEIGSWVRMNLLAARHQANRSIALADPSSELPEWTP